SGIGLSATVNKGIINEATPVLNENFSAYSADDDLIKLLSKFPPLAAPFVQLNFSGETQKLLLQKIGNITSAYSLMTYWNNNGQKYGIWTGSHFWRWFSHYHNDKNNFEEIDAFFGQIVQYLTVIEDKRQFKISLPKLVFSENDKVSIGATLLDKNLKAYLKSTVNLKIENEKGDVFPFVMNPEIDQYSTLVSHLPEGDYTAIAQTKIGNESFSASARFSISANNIETSNLTANHQLLNLLSANSNGKSFYLNQLKLIKEELNKTEYKTSIVRERKTMSLLINEKLIAFVIIALMSFEWATRKILGSY
ncbi:MAG: hypothetical protein KDC92_12800, partial [Bacteroidetes bacterium]|nr:hypothetical protein [Bacteroidota bacterium]